MHIPDGFLSVGTAATTYVISAGGVANAVRIANKKLGDNQVPMMGILAAFIFAAQMLNFPVAGGTSGHFLGAALAAIVLGPWAALLILTAVLLGQSLIFQDGGLLALGANVFNMGIVGSFTAYYLHKWISRGAGASSRGATIGVFVASWASVVVASFACSIELAMSGATPFAVVIPAMVGVHALIGIGEGLITAAVVSLIAATRSDLLQLETI